MIKSVTLYHHTRITQGTYCEGQGGLDKCSKCTGFRSAEQIKRQCNHEQQCLVNVNDRRFFIEHHLCNGLEANMRVVYKCLNIPGNVDYFFSFIFFGGIFLEKSVG